MITNKNEAKAIAKRISCDCKSKFNSITSNSKQKWNNKTCQCRCRNSRKCKKDYSWNSSTYICENSKYIKSIADTSVTECNEIIIVMVNVLTEKTNNIVNCHSKTVVRDRYILHTVSSVIILQLIITIICYYYAKQK